MNRDTGPDGDWYPLEPITVSGRYQVYSPSRDAYGWATYRVANLHAKRVSDVELDQPIEEAKP